MGHYKYVAYQADSITLEGCCRQWFCTLVSCLVLSTAKNIYWYQNMDPKVEVSAGSLPLQPCMTSGSCMASGLPQANLLLHPDSR